jgi:hypothetical protein
MKFSINFNQNKIVSHNKTYWNFKNKLMKTMSIPFNKIKADNLNYLKFINLPKKIYGSIQINIIDKIK